MIENPYIESSFGKLLDDKNRKFICNATQLEFTNKTFVEAISYTSPMRGRKYKNVRLDLIILDDYQSEDYVRTEEAREKKWKRYSDDVKEFYYKNEYLMQYYTLWSEFWDCLELSLDYFENPNSFKKEVQGDVDPASSGGRKNDYCAYMIGSTASNAYKYCRKGELGKINARQEVDKYIDHMIELLLEYQYVTHVFIEKNTFNGAMIISWRRKLMNI